MENENKEQVKVGRFGFFKKIFSIKVLAVLILLLLIGSLSSSAYLFKTYQKTKELLNNPTQAAKEETKSLTAKVGKLLDLPNEEPTVATIVDSTKLKDQPFFSKAKNGDKVILYTNAKKAILYRPSENKIIDVAPINIGANTPGVAGAKTATLSGKIAIYNGTTTPGAITQVEKTLKDKFPDVQIALKQAAAKSDYETTLVIDLTGNNTDSAQNLATELKGQVASLPEGESSPDTPAGPVDFLIILGKSSL